MGWEEQPASCHKPAGSAQRTPRSFFAWLSARGARRAWLLLGLIAVVAIFAVGSIGVVPRVLAAPVAQATAGQQQGVLAIVGANGARLYVSPGGEVTGDLSPGTVLTAVGRTSDNLWLVAYNNTGVSGWVEAREVVIFGLEQLPVMVEGAAPLPGEGESATAAPPLLPTPTSTPPPTATPTPSPTPTVTPTPSPTPPPTATPTPLPAPTRATAAPSSGNNAAINVAPGQVSIVAVVRGGGAQLYDRPDGEVTASLATGTALTAWGRSSDSSWVVVTSADGNAGWVMTNQVVIFNVGTLPMLEGDDMAAAGQAPAEVAGDTVDSSTAVTTTSTGEEAPVEDESATNDPAPDNNNDSGITATITVTDSRLNIRSGPGTNYPVVGKAYPEEIYSVLGRNRAATWIQLETPDLGEGYGWVAAEYVALSQPILGIPVSEQAGTPSPTATSTPAAPSTSTAAASAGSGLNGRLVFQSVNGGMIYVYDLATGSVRELTGGFDPAISPDGNTVAFTRIGGDHGLYLIDIDGSNERRIWNGGEQLRAPTWSPDGQWIAFVHIIGEFRCRDLGFGICLPSNPFLESFPLERQPEWGLSRVDFNGENYRDLPALTSAQAPDWTADQIVYQANSGIEITADRPQAETRPVIKAPWYQDPTRQPNGDRVVFQAREGTHWEIFTVNVDGSGLAALTRPVTNLVDELPSNVAPAWSPDGKWIVYLSNRDENNSAGAWRLWVMDADGGNQRPLPVNVEIEYSYTNEQVVSWGVAG